MHESTESAAAVLEAASGSGDALGPRVVLYIEDNVTNVRLVERMLATREQVTLISALDAKGGLALARRRRPALILLDLDLPDMHGTDVLDRLRAWPDTCDIPVVILTAEAAQASRARLLAAGAIAYVTKPFEMAELLALVDELCD
jgi:CheY-like chemotaxis protein